jgi:hypothetical protein
MGNMGCNGMSMPPRCGMNSSMNQQPPMSGGCNNDMGGRPDWRMRRHHRRMMQEQMGQMGQNPTMMPGNSFNASNMANTGSNGQQNISISTDPQTGNISISLGGGNSSANGNNPARFNQSSPFGQQSFSGIPQAPSSFQPESFNTGFDDDDDDFGGFGNSTFNTQSFGTQPSFNFQQPQTQAFNSNPFNTGSNVPSGLNTNPLNTNNLFNTASTIPNMPTGLNIPGLDLNSLMNPNLGLNNTGLNNLGITNNGGVISPLNINLNPFGTNQGNVDQNKVNTVRQEITRAVAALNPAEQEALIRQPA